MKNEILKADENIFEALEVANSGYENQREESSIYTEDRERAVRYSGTT